MVTDAKAQALLERLAERVDAAIARACPAPVGDASSVADSADTVVPGRESFGEPLLIEAMRYSLLTPGKRIRPLLFLAAVECIGNRSGADEGAAADFAAAIEMIHAYSLIHDDLPAMDDDDLRRGRPTSHKVYGEGMAILAGDGLLTGAFERMCKPVCDLSVQLDVVREVAAAAGPLGMVGGQAADIQAEGVTPDEATVRSIHGRKTGSLIACSARAGARIAGANSEELAALDVFGARFGLAFQIADDIKDEVLPTSETGKTAGGDAAAMKMTFPRVHGIEGARELCRAELAAAQRALAPLGAPSAALALLASDSVLPALYPEACGDWAKL